MFDLELADALELLLTAPTLGVSYGERRGIEIRRVLLPRSRYHAYFSYDERSALIELRAVWHATRGRGPRL